MHTITINEQRGHELEGEWRECMSLFGGRKGKEAM